MASARLEPSAPEFTELDVTAVTPVHSYQPAPCVSTQTVAPLAADKILVGAWDAGFCSCLNHVVPNALMATCCPWISVAQITSRLGLYPFAKTLLLVLAIHVGAWAGLVLGLTKQRRHPFHSQDSTDDRHHIDHRHTDDGFTWHTHWSAWFVLSLGCGLLYVAALWQLRGRVRDRFQISGSRAWDLLASLCCACCTVAQIATHVKSYSPGSCGLGPPADVLPAFPAPTTRQCSHVR